MVQIDFGLHNRGSLHEDVQGFEVNSTMLIRMEGGLRDLRASIKVEANIQTGALNVQLPLLCLERKQPEFTSQV